MTAFTNSIPAASHTLAFDQPLMLANNQYLQTSVGVDHNFTANTGTTQDGHHKVIHFVKQVGDPAPSVNIGQLYTKTVGADVQLFWLSGAGTPEQLSATTGGSPGGNGFVYLAGGILLQWGSVAVNSNTNTTVSFPTAFPTTCFNVSLTRQRANSDPGSSFGFWVVNSSITTTQFQLRNNDGHSYGYFWMAIGN